MNEECRPFFNHNPDDRSIMNKPKMTNETLILHHYDASPYSEKVRLFLGYKQLPWFSVQMPPMLPKPDLLALTGGYRRAPVLQIGADIYCDSALILDELERRYSGDARKRPDPGAEAHAALFGQWVDVDLFWRIVRYVMGINADQLPQALLDDRAAMHAHARLDRKTLKEECAEVGVFLRISLLRLEQALGDNEYFGGRYPAMGDFSVYHALWFLDRVDGLKALAAEATKLPRWMARMESFGYGKRREISAADALAVAASTASHAPASTQAGVLTTGFAVGQKVGVMPEGYPKESVAGQLLYAGDERLTISRTTPAGSEVRLHFPRLGYSLTALQ